MKKSKILATMATALALSLTVASCGGASSKAPAPSGSSAAAPKKGAITINYSTWAAEGEAAYEGMKEFKRLLEEGSNGEIVVNLFPSNQMGSTEEQLEQVSLGTLHMMSSGNPGSLELEYLSLPYLFEDNSGFIDFLSSDIGKRFNQTIIDQRGVYNISILPRSPRIVSCNNEINKPADFAGVKIRVPERDYYVKTFQAFGSNPTPMDMGEVYSAIQTGVVSGQENPIETIVSYGFQNICKYLIVTNHIVKPAFVSINNKFFNELTPEYQKLVSESCIAANTFAEGVLSTEMKNYYTQCTDAGMTVIEPDLAPFKAATQGVRDELGTKIWGEETYKKIVDIAAGK